MALSSPRQPTPASGRFPPMEDRRCRSLCRPVAARSFSARRRSCPAAHTCSSASSVALRSPKVKSSFSRWTGAREKYSDLAIMRGTCRLDT